MLPLQLLLLHVHLLLPRYRQLSPAAHLQQLLLLLLVMGVHRKLLVLLLVLLVLQPQYLCQQVQM
jgi:hypothetical protein